jgi:predicted dehydrogenase
MAGLSAGGGFASTAHLPALRAVDGYEIVGVAARSISS